MRRRGAVKAPLLATSITMACLILQRRCASRTVRELMHSNAGCCHTFRPRSGFTALQNVSNGSVCSFVQQQWCSVRRRVCWIHYGLVVTVQQAGRAEPQAMDPARGHRSRAVARLQRRSSPPGAGSTDFGRRCGFQRCPTGPRKAETLPQHLSRARRRHRRGPHTLGPLER